MLQSARRHYRDDIIQCESISIQSEFRRDESVRSSSGHFLRRIFIFIIKEQYGIVFGINQLWPSPNDKNDKTGFVELGHDESPAISTRAKWDEREGKKRRETSTFLGSSVCGNLIRWRRNHPWNLGSTFLYFLASTRYHPAGRFSRMPP